MQDALLNALAQGALLLTANRRLARRWRISYNEMQQQSGALAWPSPAIRAWPDWVNESIDALLPDRLAPTSFAEHRAWCKVIGTDPLIDAEATAQTAAQAWTLCQQYQVPLGHAAFDDAEDTARFREWAREFEQRTARQRWLPAAARELWLAQQLTESPREVWLDGFDEIAPSQRRLLAKLRTQTYKGPAQAAGRITRCHFPDARAELNAAASWARTLLETGEARSIGIVVQGLADLRPAAEAIFEDVLGARLFNISLGLPLSRWPIVSDALLCLRWLGHPLDIGSAGVLLRSPFLKGAEAERRARAQFDLQLRSGNVLEVTPGRVSAAGPPILSRATHEAITLLAAQPSKQSPGTWARLLPDLLKAAGWPGDRSQSSAERQALARWPQVLRELAALDVVEGPVLFSEAVSMLNGIADEAIFQPETAEMPVQILEALQAAGSRFDALWAAGMTSTVWPAPARPNPFLPRSLQREFDLPHATPERELRFAREITERIVRSANTVVFSHPERNGDEELRPSRLIEEYPELPPEAKHYPSYGIAAKLEETKDISVPKLDTAAGVPGGVSILSWQSQCPFRAFAIVRLQAEEWVDPEPGLSAADRGNALHEALASFWSRFKTKDALDRASQTERDAALEEAARVGCAKLPTAGGERLIALEHLRIRAVLDAWLEFDLNRKPFTVEGIETKIDLTPAGLPIRARADRIDRLPGGELVIIDYKSTAPSKAVWEGERPDNLQLPIYAVAMPETPSAIVFAQLKRGKHGFTGLAAADGLLDNLKQPKEGWTARLETWRVTIDRIWKEFQEGRADIDPKDGGRPCINCHLQGLCRIRDTGLLPDGEDADEVD